jgi:UDPglucose--hexose-1-phosphate uridylyltransferase
MSSSNWQFPHRRWNPLKREWVLVSPHRTQRPWQGEVTKTNVEQGPVYDPACYLCPGNDRAGGGKNPVYKGVFSFVNDYSALLPDSPAPAVSENSELLHAEQERGICKVLCFHPNHNLTLARMEEADITRVVAEWTKEFKELAAVDWIQSVQIFENRGSMMGASNPHPHCQIWSTSHVPDELARELESEADYQKRKGSCLLCDYLKLELQSGERIIAQNEAFAALVPWWAVWPFEAIVLSKRHCGALPELEGREPELLANILSRVAIRYDNLFETSFPYTMGLHQSPVNGKAHPEHHFHVHFFPPLLRSATVRKFMVGFEMLGMPQRDLTAESAAERLRALSEVHYSHKA